MTSVLFVFTLAWMLLVFLFSSQTAAESSRISKKIFEVLGNFYFNMFSCEGTQNISVLFPHGECLIRTAGHVIEYFILGILILLLLRKLRFRKYVIIAAGICMLYAIGDEIHQFFVPGRGPQVTDVIVDTASSILGIILFDKA